MIINKDGEILELCFLFPVMCCWMSVVLSVVTSACTFIASAKGTPINHTTRVVSRVYSYKMCVWRTTGMLQQQKYLIISLAVIQVTESMIQKYWSDKEHLWKKHVWHKVILASLVTLWILVAVIRQHCTSFPFQSKVLTLEVLRWFQISRHSFWMASYDI